VIERDSYYTLSDATFKSRARGLAAIRLLIRNEERSGGPITLEVRPRTVSKDDATFSGLGFATDSFIHHADGSWSHCDLIELTVNGRKPGYLVSVETSRHGSRSANARPELIYAADHDEALAIAEAAFVSGDQNLYGKVTITDLNAGYYPGWGIEPDQNHAHMRDGDTSKNVDYFQRVGMSTHNPISHQTVDAQGQLVEQAVDAGEGIVLS
jgi:hypothetical protein